MSWLLPTTREEILIVSFDFDLVIKNDRGGPSVTWDRAEHKNNA
jgi:hypothetical protein